MFVYALPAGQGRKVLLAVLYRNCVASSIQRMSRKNGEKQPRRLKTIQWRNGAVQKNVAFGKGAAQTEQSSGKEKNKVPEKRREYRQKRSLPVGNIA